MFERFTDRARRVLVLAHEEALLLKHNYLGTEHILLGLLHEGGGVAAQTLGSFDVSLDAARGKVEDIIGQGQVTPSGHVPFTPRARRVLELSLREALQLGHNYIGTEHLVLGILREGEGVAAQVLVGLGVKLDEVRPRTLEVLERVTAQQESQANRPKILVAVPATARETIEELIKRVETTFASITKKIEDGEPLDSLTEGLEFISRSSATLAEITKGLGAISESSPAAVVPPAPETPGH